MDREKREAYDAIAGFSGGAVNPFNDTSYERNQVRHCTVMRSSIEVHRFRLHMPLTYSRSLQVFVSEYDCIGCKNCTNVCSKTFAIEDDYGRARAMQQGA